MLSKNATDIIYDAIRDCQGCGCCIGGGTPEYVLQLVNEYNAFSEYQKQAVTTAIYPEQFKIMYPALGAGNELGEVQGKIKKVYRDNNGVFTEDHKKEIGKEIGDSLWYLAALANDLGLNLGQIAQENLDKLASRQVRGVLGGSGDNR